ncbi:MAG: three-Cys-motif partner protein TcmP, partial [Actinobacteria bacterium]|nr:three-Cys-motif partner protein TcmP [Actinomycetota bacterium]
MVDSGTACLAWPQAPGQPPLVEGQQGLFPAAEFATGKPRTLKPLSRPLWTELKAALVARYLYYFIFITKHGTYIDAFAGRQSDSAHEGWAVEEVLKNQPDWLRRYFLFERSMERAVELEELPARFPGRAISITVGDCNVELPRVLGPGSLRKKEAAFCLLDQRTFECQWTTCQHVALIKDGDYKVEQFYFLAQGWLDRSLAASTTPDGEARVERWWGRPDWGGLRTLAGIDRARMMAGRFTSELGYAEATPWPIFEAERGGGRVMYYMIHAT